MWPRGSPRRRRSSWGRPSSPSRGLPGTRTARWSRCTCRGRCRCWRQGAAQVVQCGAVRSGISQGDQHNKNHFWIENKWKTSIIRIKLFIIYHCKQVRFHQRNPRQTNKNSKHKTGVLHLPAPHRKRDSIEGDADQTLQNFDRRHTSRSCKHLHTT